MQNFIRFIGNASTTAYFGGKKLGHNVSVALYDIGRNRAMLRVESNGATVPHIPPQFIGLAFASEITDTVFEALERFNCKTAASQA